MATALVIRHIAFEDLGIAAPVLAEAGLEARYWDAGIDDPAALAPGADSDEAALLVVLGGPIGVGDLEAYPLLADELAAIRRRLAVGRPVLGVCLGAQLIAAAVGGGVEPGAAEIGWAPLSLSLAGRDGLLAPLDGVPVLHWHGDRILLPAPVESAPAPVVLASTPTTPVQAFSLPGALGLQFHLEADPSRIERWLIGHAHELASNGVDLADVRTGAAAAQRDLVPAGQAVLRGWLASSGL